MIKIKVKDKENYVSITEKYKNYSSLEAIIMLDKAIDVLHDDFELSDDEIWELLKYYRANLKEKESD